MYWSGFVRVLWSCALLEVISDYVLVVESLGCCGFV